MKHIFFHNGRLKKTRNFQNCQFSILFSWKFQGLVLGLVGLIDAKGIDVVQPVLSSGCPTKAQKQPKNTKLWELKNSVFWVGHFELFKKMSLLNPNKNQLKFFEQQGWVKILMITLVSSKFFAIRNITLSSVHLPLLDLVTCCSGLLLWVNAPHELD